MQTYYLTEDTIRSSKQVSVAGLRSGIGRALGPLVGLGDCSGSEAALTPGSVAHFSFLGLSLLCSDTGFSHLVVQLITVDSPG